MKIAVGDQRIIASMTHHHNSASGQNSEESENGEDENDDDHDGEGKDDLDIDHLLLPWSCCIPDALENFASKVRLPLHKCDRFFLKHYSEHGTRFIINNFKFHDRKPIWQRLQMW